jgi:hypothetical protein
VPQSAAVASEKSGFVVRYASARALQKDHTSHFMHGGMLIPWPSAAPVEGTPVVVRVHAPDGTLFEIAAHVGRSMAPHGFVVDFEPVAQNRPRAVLDMYMKGGMFKRAIESERATDDPPKPTIEAFGAIKEIAPIDGESEVDFDAAADALDARRQKEAVDDDPTPAGTPLNVDDMSLPPSIAEFEQTIATADPTDPSGFDPDENAMLAQLEAEQAIVLPEGVQLPGPGEEYVVYIVRYNMVRDYVPVVPRLEQEQRISFAYEEKESKPGDVAQVRLTLPGHNIYKMYGLIESTSGGNVQIRFDEKNEIYRKSVLFTELAQAKGRLKNEGPGDPAGPEISRFNEVRPSEDPDKMPIRRRLQRMGMDDKINLAQSGGREERMALAMDSNKAIHHYLLRNAKISLDEIAFMARLPSMNPDVLEKIAENPSYTQNPSVVKALVYNPKTPVLTAIRLLDRLPRAEVVNLAKRTGMNLRLVMAAKKKLESKRW